MKIPEGQGQGLEVAAQLAAVLDHFTAAVSG